MRDLKEQTHGRGQTDPLITGQSQDLDSGKEEKQYNKFMVKVTGSDIKYFIWAEFLTNMLMGGLCFGSDILLETIIIVPLCCIEANKKSYALELGVGVKANF